MENEKRPFTVSSSWKRILCLLLICATVVGMLPATALAAWDGQGGSGDSGASTVTGDYSMVNADERDIVGYRFTCYTSSGVKDGYSYDIDRYAHGYSTLYRAYGTNKQSHVDLFRAYCEDSGSVDTHVNATANNYYWELDTSLPDVPTEVEGWLTESMAYTISLKCKASNFDANTSYIIIEPIILAKVEGNRFACTMAEYACYQSSLDGYSWTGLGAQDAYTSGTT